MRMSCRNIFEFIPFAGDEDMSFPPAGEPSKQIERKSPPERPFPPTRSRRPRLNFLSVVYNKQRITFFKYRFSRKGNAP